VVLAGAVFVLVAVWRPLVVLAVSATLAVAVAGSENASGPFIMATAVATYTVATRTDRRTAWLTCFLTAGQADAAP
jgi:hypothetical protein